jgi:hypothetical protein
MLVGGASVNTLKSMPLMRIMELFCLFSRLGLLDVQVQEGARILDDD